MKNALNISLPPALRGEVSLKVYNTSGRLMKLEKVVIGDAGYTLDMRTMQAGTYILQVEGPHGSWKKSIIKI